MRTVRATAAVVLLLTAAGCGSRAHHREDRSRVVAGGCGTTPLQRGRLPAWTAPAFAQSSPGPPPQPHAISQGGDVAALVFGYPLRAGHPTNPSDKVLWIMRLPRDASRLQISAHPLEASAPLVRLSEPPDSEPGEIYPSEVDLPSAGCWHLTLRWAGHTDAIDLRYID